MTERRSLAEPLYPDVVVLLKGDHDDNERLVIVAVRDALREQVSVEAANRWVNEAIERTSYAEVLMLAMQTVQTT